MAVIRGISVSPYVPVHCRWGNYRDIGARTEESCTQYNVLKVARHLFQWSADAKLAGREGGVCACVHWNLTLP